MTAAPKLDELDEASFRYLRSQLQDLAGISLSEAKTDLLISRLRKRLLTLRMESLKDYVAHLKSLSKRDEEWQIFLNCLTTNKTDFFREPDHFRFLVNEVLPLWRKSNSRQPMRLWSVPCSTGEEPYTLAMVLHEARKTNDFQFQIAASDIDTKVLPVAKNGVYKRSRLSEIPPAYQKEAIAGGTEGIADWIKIKPHLREYVSFQHCNLIAPPFPWDKPFDVIFCRNVLIYFSNETIGKVVRNLHEVAGPGAFLFVGHSESLQNHERGWERVHSSVYRKKGN